jgi:ABC-2 type transport system ATP-binding protein
MEMRQPAVELRGLTKRFRRSGDRSKRTGRRPGVPWRRSARADLVALHPLDLQLERGGITGVIGPNGSGKSTLVRILATLVLPDQGSARVFGLDVVRDSLRVRRHLNRVSVEAAFFKELSPWENLVYAARIYGTDDRLLRRRVEDVLGRFGLPADVVDRPLRQLSRGQQQKVAIARSVLTTPSLLLMDEPTTGLDPRSKREVQEMVAELRREQVTTLLCTHDMDEAEALCDRVLLMDRGRVLADGTPAQLGRLETVFFELSGRAMEDADSETDAEEDDRPHHTAPPPGESESMEEQTAC